MQAWRGFAKAHDTNITALLEALGLELAHMEDTPLGRLPSVLRGAVVESRRLAAARTRRSGVSGGAEQ